MCLCLRDIHYTYTISVCVYELKRCLFDWSECEKLLFIWAERDDGRGEEAGSPEGAGRSGERGGQETSDRTERRATDPEVSERGEKRRRRDDGIIIGGIWETRMRGGW